MTHPVLIRPACLDRVNGDLIVAMLLSQIVYWSLPGKNGHTKLRIVRDGVYWIAKTRAEWMAETGLTLDRYKRAITVLQARSLVEVRVMRFQGIAQTHVRLVHPVATYQSEGNPPSTVVEKPPTGWRVSPQPYTETTAESTQRVRIRTGCASTTISTKTHERIGRSEERRSEEQEEHRENRSEEKRRAPRPLPVRFLHGPCSGAHQSLVPSRRRSMTAREILNRRRDITTGSLGPWWLSRCALHLTKQGYQRALTGQQMGQLKQLKAYIGEDTKAVMAFAIEHWWKFASRAGASAGTSFPADPHIGFLLKHHAVAVNLLRESQGDTLHSVEPLVGAPGATVQSIATGMENDPVHVVTSQELTELLEGLTSP